MAILCGTDTSFLLNLWDLLLHQAEHTLNMLQPSSMTPTVSAYTYLWGNMITTQTPLLPCDAKSNHIWYLVSVRHGHHTRQADTTWEHRGNITAATKYTSSTPITHICEYLTMPSLPPADALIQAADDLTTSLAGVIPPHSMTTEAITQLINIFKT